MSAPIDEPADLSASSLEPEDVHNVPASPLLELLDEDEPLMTRSQAFNLYTTHFLSTWNVRTYEFAAVSQASDTVNGNANSLDYLHRCSLS